MKEHFIRGGYVMAGKKKKSGKKQKEVKVYFCPKCRSMDVGFVFGIRNLMGILPMMQCKKCGFRGGVFPLVVISKEKLKKLNKKVEKKNKK
tara:strand:- start:5236 stop:5508 length:273 start_codon:yes stop_codon:yes gene_type:complete